MIKISNITKHFPGVVALNCVTLHIKEGEIFGLLGPNGAGKSTLMNLLIGYIDSDEGEIFIDNQRITRESFNVREKIGLVPQSIALYDELSAQENLEIFGGLFNVPNKKLKEVIAERLSSVELFDRRKDKVKTFSGGMKRRLNLIASLLHDPKILLCDEPTVGVDPQSRNAIFEFLTRLNDEGKTIIYTTHYMEEAERLCSRLAIIDMGKIVIEGTIDQLLNYLPYDQTILISKNADTIHHTAGFESFGVLIDEQDHFELKPSENFRLSSFFNMIETEGITYKSVGLKKPSLEALFLHLTGRRLRD